MFVACFTEASVHLVLIVLIAEELELLGGPGYEMAKGNLDLLDSLIQEGQEFYDKRTKRLDHITAKHDEEQRLQAKKKN